MFKIKFEPMGEHQVRVWINGVLICYLSNYEVTRIRQAEMLDRLDAFDAIEEAAHV